jgi:transposase
LYFQVLRHNVKTQDVLRFVRWLRRKLGRGLIIVWDGLSQHRSAAKRLASDGYIVVELPGYAPDLNPDEWVWRHAKHVDLGNSCPDDLDDLQRRLTRSLRAMHRRPALLRAFFRGARLSL